MEHRLIWDPVMCWGEEDMLLCRMEAFADAPCEVRHVVTESRFTHRGVPKPLTFPASALAGDPEFCYVVDDREPDPDPRVNEHHQRNAAWKVIDAGAADDDAVLICDLDEIPSPELLACAARYGTEGPPFPVSVAMRLFMFAADWEADWRREPPPCVMAPAGWLRRQAASGYYLAEVRDARQRFPRLGTDDQTWGWHFSWAGGPERQKDKLLNASFHKEEIMATPEGDLILSGARYRGREDGGGIPVTPVDVDETWPAYVYERRCPASWFRPRDKERTA